MTARRSPAHVSEVLPDAIRAIPGDGRALPRQLPAGLTLPGGHVLTFEPHRDCPCIDCALAFLAYRVGYLDDQLPAPGGDPW